MYAFWTPDGWQKAKVSTFAQQRRLSYRDPTAKKKSRPYGILAFFGCDDDDKIAKMHIFSVANLPFFFARLMVFYKIREFLINEVTNVILTRKKSLKSKTNN